MKIAVCLSGQPRTFNKVASKIFSVFHDADFYFSTWYTEKDSELISVFEKNDANLVSYEFIKEPLQVLNEKYIAEKFLNSYPDFFILNQWYGVSRVISLALECSKIYQKKYDLIVRCRFDVNFNFVVDELISKYRNDCLNYVEAISKGTDQFFFGSPEIMGDLTEFPDWLLDYPIKFGTEYGFYASPLVKAFFLDKNYNLNKINVPMTVVRPPDSTYSPRELRENRTRDYIRKHFPELDGILWAGDRAEEIKKITLKRPAPWQKEFYPNEKRFYIDGV